MLCLIMNWNNINYTNISQFLHCIWLVENCFDDVTIKYSCNISEHFAIQFQSAICLLFSYLIWHMLQLAARTAPPGPQRLVVAVVVASGGPAGPRANGSSSHMMKLWLILLWPVFTTIPILMITRGLVIKNAKVRWYVVNLLLHTSSYMTLG